MIISFELGRSFPQRHGAHFEDASQAEQTCAAQSPFEKPTIRAMYLTYLEKVVSSDMTSIQPAEKQDFYPVSSAQKDVCVTTAASRSSDLPYACRFDDGRRVLM
ncbi:hypothetical protein ACEQPO_02330 [Bacillus sp. SL00103]